MVMAGAARLHKLTIELRRSLFDKGQDRTHALQKERPPCAVPPILVELNINSLLVQVMDRVSYLSKIASYSVMAPPPHVSYAANGTTMELHSYSNYSELGALESDWNSLARQGLYFIPSFSELKNYLKTTGCKFILLTAVENSTISAIACFVFGTTTKEYRIAKIKLWHLRVRSISLFGCSVLGQPSEDLIRGFFHHVLKVDVCDLIDIGAIFIHSPLYEALTNLYGAITWRASRKERTWWLIQMPNSFDEYLRLLPKKTRFHLTRDLRRFERESPEFRVIISPEEIDEFLRDAEQISRLTYQWDLTYGISNNDNTRKKFMRLAKERTLRCYITYLQGKPCAFGWGELSHNRFSFRQTGYDPKYRRLAPGTALIMRMIRDLIENTDCQVFDLQWGGKDGYKSRFGTVGVPCATIQVAPYKPYSLLIVALDQMLKLAKNFIGVVVEHTPLKVRLRSKLRRHGVGTF